MRGAPARQTIIRFALAGLLFLMAGLFWWQRPSSDISPERARTIADLLFVRYTEHSGEPELHFDGPRATSYPDGWEYHWVYMPCADIGELRIFVSRQGDASYAITPDCHPVRGFAVPPQKV